MRTVILALRAGAVVVLLAFVASLVVDGGPRAESSGARTAAPTGPAAVERPTTPRDEQLGPPGEVIAFVAAGDVGMGSDRARPPDSLRLFGGVAPELAGDVVVGNLEGTLGSGGRSRCGAEDAGCVRTPAVTARWLADAGFTIMSLANGHALDYGAAGARQTASTLTAAGVGHTGRPGQITTVKVRGVRVAVLGFAPDRGSASLGDVRGAARLVRRAAATHDLVLVVMHAGAEGADRQHVKAGVERQGGRSRGDPVRFARAAVDAGADLVVGSGPHVLRGMEWYRGRLIAYSLGALARYGAPQPPGPLSTSAILRVEIRGDGTFESGLLVPTMLVGQGVPARDPAERAHGAIRELSREDFGAAAVKVSPNGILGRPPALAGRTP